MSPTNLFRASSGTTFKVIKRQLTGFSGRKYQMVGGTTALIKSSHLTRRLYNGNEETDKEQGGSHLVASHHQTHLIGATVLASSFFFSYVTKAISGNVPTVMFKLQMFCGFDQHQFTHFNCQRVSHITRVSQVTNTIMGATSSQ